MGANVQRRGSPADGVESLGSGTMLAGRDPRRPAEQSVYERMEKSCHITTFQMAGYGGEWTGENTKPTARSRWRLARVHRKSFCRSFLVLTERLRLFRRHEKEGERVVDPY